MSSIPDAGDGASEFICHWLWQVYRYFPSHGHYDWLLLFLCISILIHLLFIPHLWQTVESDIRILKEGKVIGGGLLSSHQNCWAAFWSWGLSCYPDLVVPDPRPDHFRAGSQFVFITARLDKWRPLLRLPCRLFLRTGGKWWNQ